MAGKRDRNVQTAGGGDEVSKSSKRRREEALDKPKAAQVLVDPTYGQRPAFPGLDEPAEFIDNDLQFEDMGDALSYLRSVR